MNYCKPNDGLFVGISSAFFAQKERKCAIFVQISLKSEMIHYFCKQLKAD